MLDLEDVFVGTPVRGAFLLIGVSVKIQNRPEVEPLKKMLSHAFERWVVKP